MPAAFADLLEPIARRLRGRRGPLLFSFNGGAGGFPGMGAELFAEEPVFRATIEHATPIVRDVTGFDPLPAFTERTPAAVKTEDLILLGLVQLGQCELWRAAGFEPDATLGVSLGEAGAVYAAGGLSFEDAVRVVCAIGEGSRDGLAPHTLFMFEATRAEAVATLATSPVPLYFSATVGPGVSAALCDRASEDAAAAHIGGRHRILKRTASPRATHTRLGPSVRPKMERLLGDIRPRPLDRPCFLAASGRDVRSDAHADARYWSWMHDHAIFYAETVEAAFALRPGVVVQIGATPVHRGHLLDAARRAGCATKLVDTMNPPVPEPEAWQAARGTVAAARGRRRPVAPPEAGARTLDLDDPELRRDPSAALAALRREGPVHRLAHTGEWLVLDPDLVRHVLTTPAEFSSRVWQPVDPTLLAKDPPDNWPVRRRVAKLLSPSAAEPLGARARDLTREALEERVGAREIEIVEEVVEPVVFRTVGRLVGNDDATVARLAAESRALLDPRARADHVFLGLPGTPPPGDDDPGDDGETRNGIRRLLWFAGTVTTMRHLGWVVLELARHPGARTAVARDPGLLARFLDEVQRLHPAEPTIRRTAVADVRLGDATIPAGATVAVALAAAGRDPQRYPEPDRLRLDRPSLAHFSFGAGSHRCPGARLSREIATGFVRALLDVMPDFEVVQPDCALQAIATPMAHGLSGLMIAPGR